MNKASTVSPFVCGSVAIKRVYSTEASPTETTYLGGDLYGSPTSLEETGPFANAQDALPDVPAHTIYAHPPNTPVTAFATTLSTASITAGEELGAKDARHRIARVPVPSPTSPNKATLSGHSSRRASWMNEISAKLQKV